MYVCPFKPTYSLSEAAALLIKQQKGRTHEDKLLLGLVIVMTTWEWNYIIRGSIISCLSLHCQRNWHTCGTYTAAVAGSCSVCVLYLLAMIKHIIFKSWSFWLLVIFYSHKILTWLYVIIMINLEVTDSVWWNVKLYLQVLIQTGILSMCRSSSINVFSTFTERRRSKSQPACGCGDGKEALMQQTHYTYCND